MAQPAGLDLLAQYRRRKIALRIAGFRILPPCDVAALIEAHSKALGLILLFLKRPPALLVVRPGDMARTLAMAGLAAHTNLGPGRVEMIVLCIVIFLHTGRMTLGAHEIPVLIQLCPMQDIVVLYVLVRVEMEPALAALLLRSTIPCNR